MGWARHVACRGRGSHRLLKGKRERKILLGRPRH